MPDYKYSIIIPHKNIPSLLQRCLDSIPKRDDLQVIIVDDNSDPSIVDFDHFPGLGQANTEVYFDKTDRGAGKARNVGLEHAQGEWVLFADADDAFNKDELSILLSIAEMSNYSLIFWGVFRILSTGEKVVYANCEKTSHKIVQLLDSSYPFKVNEPWRKMVRLSHIKNNDLLFEETLVSNDIMFSLRLAACTSISMIGFYNGYIYNWIQRKSSLVDSLSLKNSICRMNVSIRANSFLKKCKIEHSDYSHIYLHRIKNKSLLLFCYYFIKELIILGKRKAMIDFGQVCDLDMIGHNLKSFISFNIKRNFHS